MDLFRHSAAFVAPKRRFRRSFPAVLALKAVTSGLDSIKVGSINSHG